MDGWTESMTKILREPKNIHENITGEYRVILSGFTINYYLNTSRFIELLNLKSYLYLIFPLFFVKRKKRDWQQSN